MADKNKVLIGFTLDFAWCAGLFLLIALEAADAFRHAEIGAGYLTTIQLRYESWLAIAVLWMLFGIGLELYGLRSRILPVVVSGLISVGCAAALGAVFGTAYAPISRFVPLLNVRAGTVFALMLGLWVTARLLCRHTQTYPWIANVEIGCYATIGLFGFELLSAEIHDFFRHQTTGIASGTSDSGNFLEYMTQAVAWMLYSVPAAIYAARTGSKPVRAAAVFLAGLAVATAAIGALAFEPDTWLTPALTVRTLVLVFMAAGLFAHIRWLRESADGDVWVQRVIVAMQACIVLLGFELISTQARDLFRYHIQTAQSAEAEHLRNQEQLTLSVTWLVYAILLMVIGLWRRTRWLRLGAIGLLGFIILKIFGYDLGFLTPAYRSISLAGLGVILLAVSFLYSRYRGVLLES